MVASGIWKCCAGVLLLGLLSAAANADGDAGRDQAELTNLVLQDCGSCHGLTLRGGLGPALRPENLEHRSVEALAAIIREGIPGTAMPPWQPLLSPDEIRWISRQLKSGALVTP